MSTAKLTSKGQVTIPRAIRQYLRLFRGDRIDFRKDDDGRVYVEPARVDVRELDGILRRPGLRPVTLDEMDEAIAQHVAEDNARILERGEGE